MARHAGSVESQSPSYPCQTDSPTHSAVREPIPIRAEDLDFLSEPSEDRLTRGTNAPQEEYGLASMPETVASGTVSDLQGEPNNSGQLGESGERGFQLENEELNWNLAVSRPAVASNREGVSPTDTVRTRLIARQRIVSDSDDDVQILLNVTNEVTGNRGGSGSSSAPAAERPGGGEQRGASAPVVTNGVLPTGESTVVSEQQGSARDGQENHSDCEIVAVVPNRYGEVMNHRIVPIARPSPRARVASASNGRVPLLNGRAVGREQNTDQGCRGAPTDPPLTLEDSDFLAYAREEVFRNYRQRLLEQNRERALASMYGYIERDGTCSHSRGQHRGERAAEERPSQEAGSSNQSQDDEVVLGPICWAPQIIPTTSREYHERHKPRVSAYSMVEGESDGSAYSKFLDDIEFLFRCPICYSTIARFKSQKLPNDNDRVIYSTRCGHMYCFDCIEGVKKRRECPMCRKPLKDSKHYHVVYP
ncbi:E3 ubiquitin-protein ligase RNF4-like isoform X1 [Babesia caballi]|uniref:E3 ubiquitin-protein ligase RNF4-like isoform X1 n=1 Tax=Babesia caballi TaxID=5871 RepID=A0AAV4M1V7_BABCB|nr:E3 ubiquitin-protein ligase RNF4-like isoform X1 [Babesia caballi]